MSKPGLFESCLIIKGKIPLLPLHIKRLKKSAGELQIKVPENISRRVESWSKRHKRGLHKVKFTLSPGGKISFKSFSVNSNWLKNPNPPVCKIILVETVNNYSGNWPGNKITKRKRLSSAFNIACAQNADDALLILPNGIIAETTRANIFWIKGKTMYTPSLRSGCLKGITRNWIIKTSRQLGISIKQGLYTIEDAKIADAMFCTNAVRGIQLVSEIKGLHKFKKTNSTVNKLHKKLKPLFLSGF